MACLKATLGVELSKSFYTASAESSHSPGDTLSGWYGPEANINCLETEVDADRLNRWITLGANIGVLAGIIILGLEIRQNTLVAKIDSANTLEQNLRGMTMSIWSNPDFARILKVGIDGDLTDLTAVESLQLRVALTNIGKPSIFNIPRHLTRC